MGGTRRESSPPSQPERARTSSACEACRARKSKCNGERPACSKCIARHSACTYSTIIPLKVSPSTVPKTLGVSKLTLTPDERKYKQLEKRKAIHEELFEMLRTLSEQESLDVFQRVRAGTDLESVLNQIKDGNLLMQLSLVPEHRSRYNFPFLREMPAYLLQSPNVYANTLIFDYSFGKENRPQSQDQSAYASIYMKPYHSAEVVEPKLDLIRPSEWTSICSNDLVMRKLLLNFFLSEYHLGTFFHKDYFLDDMAAGRLHFCSSLLVNAVLAWACFCDAENPHRAEFWNPDNLGYQFLAEARRLWELTAGEPKLTTVQTALIFNNIYNMNGVDKLGYYYNTRAVAMANDLRLFKPSPNRRVSKREQDGNDFTAWAVYAWQGPNSYMMHKPPLCKHPPRTPLPDPFQRPDWYGAVRFKFPSDPTMFSYFAQYSMARIQLWGIAIDIASEVFVEDGSKVNKLLPTVEQVFAYCVKLRKWYAALPESLQPTHIVTPYQLQLHMQYHNFIINLLEEPMATQLENLGARSLEILHQPPKEMLLESKHSLEMLIRLYYLRHSFQANNAMMVQYLSLLAFSTYAAIRAGTDLDSTSLQSLRSTIILAALGLRDQSHSTFIGQLVFNAVRDTMGAEEADLIDKFTGQGRAVAKQPPKDWKLQTIWAVDFRNIAAEKKVLSDLIKDDGE